ncbi:MAG: EF-P lysine aminoacylase GenX [Candidatus Magasanikbacteria bacterium]|nr:EF-P lysine aminoacylase GenX [Candidatus Magasanikbacteria bacterium]
MSNWIEIKDNPRLKKIYETRLQILRLIREFFWSENFVEAETPIALRLPGQEPYLNPMPVEFLDPRLDSHRFYLRTSPEYALKKLLATGYEKIFEIGKCFRNEESFGGTHNPEFTMIEWYRAPGTYIDFMDDTEKLFKYVGKKLSINKLGYKDFEIDLDNTWERISVKDLWKNYLNVNLDDYLQVEPMRKLATDLGYQVSDSDEYEDLFYKIFLNKIEIQLGKDAPTFVYDYPAQMCSLSKKCQHDPRYAQRAELYIGGLEIANGFGELVDAALQRENLQKDRILRARLNRPTWEVDPGFIAALESGIKPAGGIALGVDRMVLLFTGARDINEVIFQSAADQLSN